MTVNELFHELQKLKLDGHGEDVVLICDMTNEPPVPEVLDHVKVLKNIKKVFLYGETVEQMVAELSKRKQNKANGINC